MGDIKKHEEENLFPWQKLDAEGFWEPPASNPFAPAPIPQGMSAGRFIDMMFNKLTDSYLEKESDQQRADRIATTEFRRYYYYNGQKHETSYAKWRKKQNEKKSQLKAIEGKRLAIEDKRGANSDSFAQMQTRLKATAEKFKSRWDEDPAGKPLQFQSGLMERMKSQVRETPTSNDVSTDVKGPTDVSPTAMTAIAPVHMKIGSLEDRLASIEGRLSSGASSAKPALPPGVSSWSVKPPTGPSAPSVEQSVELTRRQPKMPDPSARTAIDMATGYAQQQGHVPQDMDAGASEALSGKSAPDFGQTFPDYRPNATGGQQESEQGVVAGLSAPPEGGEQEQSRAGWEPGDERAKNPLGRIHANMARAEKLAGLEKKLSDAKSDRWAHRWRIFEHLTGVGAPRIIHDWMRRGRKIGEREDRARGELAAGRDGDDPDLGGDMARGETEGPSFPGVDESDGERGGIAGGLAGGGGSGGGDGESNGLLREILQQLKDLTAAVKGGDAAPGPKPDGSFVPAGPESMASRPSKKTHMPHARGEGTHSMPSIRDGLASVAPPWISAIMRAASGG